MKIVLNEVEVDPSILVQRFTTMPTFTACVGDTLTLKWANDKVECVGSPVKLKRIHSALVSLRQSLDLMTQMGLDAMLCDMERTIMCGLGSELIRVRADLDTDTPSFPVKFLQWSGTSNDGATILRADTPFGVYCIFADYGFTPTYSRAGFQTGGYYARDPRLGPDVTVSFTIKGGECEWQDRHLRDIAHAKELAQRHFESKVRSCLDLNVEGEKG